MSVRASTVSAALHRLGFNPRSKRTAGGAEGIKVSGNDPVRVAADFDDLEFGWEIARECADALTGAGWMVELSEPPRLPGLYVTGRAAPAAREEEETSMTEQELPRVGDLVTIPAHPGDNTTRTGRVLGLHESGRERGRWSLALESITASGVRWAEWWAPTTMIVTPSHSAEPVLAPECGHEITGGYVYTGDPAGSRSMEVTVRYPGESRTVPAIDHEGLWVTVLDPEGMECELQVRGLTDPLMRTVIADTDRYNGRGERYSPAEEAPMSAMGLLRACMSRYLDISGGTGLHGRTSEKGLSDMLHHMAMITRDIDDETATEWLAEELQEMLAARG